jgi:hypothetical protein
MLVRHRRPGTAPATLASLRWPARRRSMRAARCYWRCWDRVCGSRPTCWESRRLASTPERIEACGDGAVAVASSGSGTTSHRALPTRHRWSASGSSTRCDSANRPLERGWLYNRRTGTTTKDRCSCARIDPGRHRLHLVRLSSSGLATRRACALPAGCTVTRGGFAHAVGQPNRGAAAAAPLAGISQRSLSSPTASAPGGT